MRAPALAFCLALAACTQAVPEPAPLDTRNEACRSCRMAVSEARFAAQLVVPGEDPRFFDDLGCLRDFLRSSAALPEGTAAYVADHRTRAWVTATTAVYVRVPAVQTPMGSHLIAYADAASQAADPAAAAGEPLSVADIFGPRGAPDGGSRTGGAR